MNQDVLYFIFYFDATEACVSTALSVVGGLLSSGAVVPLATGALGVFLVNFAVSIFPLVFFCAPPPPPTVNLVPLSPPANFPPSTVVGNVSVATFRVLRGAFGTVVASAGTSFLTVVARIFVLNVVA